MIGTKIRGIHHLKRLTRINGILDILCNGDCGVDKFTIVNLPSDKKENNIFLICSNYDFDYLPEFICDKQVNGYDIYSELERIIKEYNYCFEWNTSNQAISRYITRYICNGLTVALPHTFKSNYDDFLNQNKKQLATVNNHFNFGDNNELSQFLYAISNGSKNFYFWAIYALFKYGMPLHLVCKIMEINDLNNGIAKKLSKGTITAYTGKDGLYQLYAELCHLRSEKRVNNVINSFNTQQKRLLRDHTMSVRDLEILSKFDKLSQKKKRNFVRKMSTETDTNKILKMMSLLCDVHFEWNKESFVDYIENNENINCDVVFENGDLMVVRVNDYETIKRLTKATNWCISKDRKYWKDYIEDNDKSEQYVMFDFSLNEDDNLSIVGFTVNKRAGITHSHDFQNNNLMRSLDVNYGRLEPFVNERNNSIFSILNKHNIDASVFTKKIMQKYEWNKESLIKHLTECVGKCGYYTLYDKDNKMIIVSNRDGLAKFLNIYEDMLDFYSDKYILFIDFNNKEDNPERIIYGAIVWYSNELCEQCPRLYNINTSFINVQFNTMLNNWGIRYDIICRPCDNVSRFYDAYDNFDIKECKRLIKIDDVKNDLFKKTNHCKITDGINMSCFRLYSMDYINMFYDEGIKWHDILYFEDIICFFRPCFFNLIDTIEHIDNIHQVDVPTDEEMDGLFSKTKKFNYEISKMIGHFAIMNKFLDNDKFKDDEINKYMNFISQINITDKAIKIVDFIVSKLMDMVDLTKNEKFVQFLFAYLNNNESSKLLDKILQKKMKDFYRDIFISKKREIEYAAVNNF